MKRAFSFKVRPRKGQTVVPCATELSTLLACFAQSGDMRSSEACAQAAKSLHGCMASKKPIVPKNKPAINYLLRKIS